MAEDVPEPEAPGGEDAPLEAGGEQEPEAGAAEARGVEAQPAPHHVGAEAGLLAGATEGGVEAQPGSGTGGTDAGAAGEGAELLDAEAPEAGGNEVEGAPEAAGPTTPAPRAPFRPPSRRTLALAAALAAIVGVIVVDVVVIVKGAKNKVLPVASIARAPLASAPPRPSTAPPGSAAAFAPKPADGGVFLDYDDGEQPHEKEPEQHVTYRTVEQAANRTCSTKSVDGLSRQIIRQSRCFDRNAFVPVPRRPNLKVKSNVYLYLEAPARRHLLNVLDANRNKTMTINSALRTVAQQYLLQEWYSNRRCGITLAALPGESNHETGLALDVAEAYKWKSAFKKQQFHWLGKVDGMHFDYKGPGAETGLHADVKAFQQLWNLNHPKDRIPDNGRYTPATEERLRMSPAAGFSHGPHCG